MKSIFFAVQMLPLLAAPAFQSFDINGNLSQTEMLSSKPVIILAQPQSRTTTPGDPVSVSVVVTGGPFDYQWQKDGVAIPGAEADTYLIPNFMAANVGAYSVVITPAAGVVVESEEAQLWLDADGDGMGDDWETDQFGNLASGGAADSDLDGQSNLQEFLDGTDPNDDESLKVTLTLTARDGSIEVTPFVPSLRYDPGTLLSLTAIPRAGYELASWEGAYPDSAPNEGHVVLGNKDTTITAHFVPVGSAVSLAEALDETLTFTTGGDGDWTGEASTAAYDEVDSARAPANLNRHESAWMETSITGPGTLTYWWQSDAHEDDGITLTVDEHELGKLLGEQHWRPVEIHLPAGAHAVRWTFVRNDASRELGSNMGRVDALTWSPGVDSTVATAIGQTDAVLATGGRIRFRGLSQYAPLALTGFDKDLIQGDDGVSDEALDGGVLREGTGPEERTYFPPDGMLSAPDAVFQLADDAGPNALYLSDLDTRTLSLSSPASWQSLQILGFAVKGDAEVMCELEFTDGARQATAMLVRHWRRSDEVEHLEFRTFDQVTGSTSSQLYLHAATVPIWEEHWGRTLAHITFRPTGSEAGDDGNTQGMAILAVSGATAATSANASIATSGRAGQGELSWLSLVLPGNQTVEIERRMPLTGANLVTDSNSFFYINGNHVPHRNGDWDTSLHRLGAGDHVLRWERAPAREIEARTIRIEKVLASPAIPLDTATDNALAWTTGGDLPWEGFAIPSLAADDVDVAISGEVEANCQSWIEATVTGPGTLRWDWRLSGELNSAGRDEFILEVDGERIHHLEGETEWEPALHTFGTGTHTLRWTFQRTHVEPENLNAAFLDNVVFTAGDLSLAEALDLPAPMEVFAYGPALWESQSATTHDGVDAIMPVPLGRFESSAVQVRVEGPLTLAYWRFVDTDARLSLYVNGDQVVGNSGLHEWAEVTHPLGPGPHVLEWIYGQGSAETGATANAWVDEVSLRQAVPLLTALDAPGQTWTTGGAADWAGAETDAATGDSAATSGAIPHGSASWIETQVIGPGVASFVWRISAGNSDAIRLLLDGETVAELTGNDSVWQEVQQTIPPGTRTLRWSYAKDSSGVAGSDSASIDAFVFTSQDPVELKEAIEIDGIDLTLTGDAAWFSQTTTTQDGIDALQSGAIIDHERTSMSANITGPGLVSFWWKVSSQNFSDYLNFNLNESSVQRISGEQDWAQVIQPIPAGQHVVEWFYEMNFSNQAGDNAGWIDQVSITTPETLADALDESGFAWTTGGDGAWAGVNGPGLAHDGADTAYSGSLPINAETWLETEVTGPGTVSFWWRPSGSSGDLATFLVNGEAQISEGGDLDWQQVERTLPAGTHVLRWLYAKDGNAPVGSDALFLDEVAFTAGIPLVDAAESAPADLLTHGDSLWASQSTTTHDGSDALQANAIGDNEEARLETIVNGPGTLAFWWKASTEGSGDRLRLYINDSQIDSIFGEADWEQITQHLTPGKHTVSWRYTKNGSGAGGSDTGWVDEIAWAPVAGSLAEAVDAPALPFTVASAAGAEGWLPQSLTLAHDGIDAAVTPRLDKGEWTSLETTVNGAGTLSFWWRSVMANGDRLRIIIDGVKRHELTATTDWQPVACTVGSGTHTVRWEWERGTSNNNASQAGWLDEMSFAPETTPELESALDGSGLEWTSSGDALWYSQGAVTNDGIDAAQSGDIDHNQQTWLQTHVTGPGTLTYWRKISSQSSDRLRLYVDGTAISAHNFSGEQDWAEQAYVVAGGSHLVQWRYTKNGSIDAGDDTAWIDQLAYTPAASGETLANALDGGSLTWSTSSSDAWTGVIDTEAHDSVDFAQSGEPDAGGSSWMETTVTGPGTLRFWWRAASAAEGDALRLLVDGTALTEIAGATDWQLLEAAIGSGTRTLRWDYTPVNGAANSGRRMQVDEVRFTAEANPALLASAATDGSSIGSIVAMISGGDGGWVAQGATTHDGVSAPESGPITHNEITWIEAVIDGPGHGQFWWNVDSQTNDIASLIIDGVPIDTRSGTGQAWEKPEFYLDSGRHHVRISYAKNNSINTGSDRTWTDEWSWSASVPNVLGNALELQDQALVTYGSEPWFSQSTTTQDGTDALQTGGITHNQQTSLSMEQAGPGWVFYWWKVSSQSSDRLRYYQDGVQLAQISGEQDWQFAMHRAGVTTERHLWQYEKNGSVDTGDDAGYLDGVEFAAPGALDSALDSALTWTTGGDAPWAGYVSSHAADGTDAASSGAIDHNESSWLETTVTGPGTLTFAAKTLSHSSDTLSVSVDGQSPGLVLSSSDWETAQLEIGAGVHTVRWTYAKNSSTTILPDVAWLDSVVWVPNAAPAYATALDAPGETLGMGSALWFSQTSTTHDGVDALQAGAISDGEATSFFRTVEGPAVLSFWWKCSSLSGDWVGWYLNGTRMDWRQGDHEWENIARELSAGTHTLEWRYTKNASGSGLDDTAWVDELEIVPYQSDYGDALDNTGLTWTSGGAAPWRTLGLGAAQTDDDLAVSGDVATGQESWMETTVTGPGEISYWTKTSSHNSDAFIFTVNGTEWDRKAGSTDWQRSVLSVPAGVHVLRWAWNNLSTSSAGSNQVWLDDVQFTATASPPLADALGNTSYPWFSTRAPWQPSGPTEAFDGVSSAQSGVIGDNDSTGIKTRVQGPAWITFQWNVSSHSFDYLRFLIDGIEVRRTSNEPGWALIEDAIPPGEHVIEWRYDKNFNTVGGQDLAWLDAVNIVPYTDFESALEGESFAWTTGGPGWAGVASADSSHDGVDTAVSLPTAVGQESWMETTITGPGTVRFWWRTDTGQDDLRLYLDGNLQTDIDFLTEWQEVILSLSAGTHTLRWTYERSQDAASPTDTAFVDDLRFIPSDPSSISTTLGSPEQTFVSYGDQNPWDVTAEGLRSGVTERNDESTVRTLVEGPALISFDWKAESDSLDRPTFRIEHNNRAELNGMTPDLQNVLARIGNGKYDLFWIYDKRRDHVDGHHALLDTIEIARPIDLATGLDALGLAWTTGGDQPWYGYPFSHAHDTTDLAASGQLDSFESSWMETEIIGPGTLGFWWKGPQYGGEDFKLLIDDIPYIDAKSADEWTYVEVAVSAGTHRVRWDYRTENSFAPAGVWVDEVKFVSETEPPLFKGFDVPVRAVVASGHSPWMVQTDQARDANGALENMPTPGLVPRPVNVAAELEGPGQLSFWYQSSDHRLTALLDNESYTLARATDWAPARFPLGQGSHRLRFQVPLAATTEGPIRIDQVSVSTIAPIALAEALDALSLPWNTSAALPWIGLSDPAAISYDGSDSGMSSPETPDGVPSWVETEVTGPGTIRFYWKAPNRSGYELAFLIDGVDQALDNPNELWKYELVPVSEGTHTLRWVAYRAPGEPLDAVQSAGLDQVTWVPGDFAFENWQALHFTPEELADPLISGAEADPDADGINNGVESALGLDPRSHSSLPLTGSGQQSDWLFTFTAASVIPVDMILHFDQSTKLSTPFWSAIADHTVNGWVPVAPATLTETPSGSFSEVTIRVPSTGLERLFGRIRAVVYESGGGGSGGGGGAGGSGGGEGEGEGGEGGERF